MHYLVLLIKYGPAIFAAIKYAAEQLPNSPGKVRLEAAIAFVTAGEAIAAEAAPELSKAVNAGYALLKAGKVVPSPAALPAPTATATATAAA